MSAEIRLALAGCGGRGLGLLELALRVVPGLEVAGVCETDPGRLERALAVYPNTRGYADFGDMLESARPDAVIVATPATYHAALCGHALLRNVHVLSEVPAVASAEEAEELWRAHLQSDALYMMGANPNMWGFVQAAADLVSEGTIGSPYYMEAEYVHDIRELYDVTPWRRTYESIRYCTHSLGPLLRLIPEDLTAVSCFDTGSHIHGLPDQHDAMAALFRTPSNVVIRLLTTFANNCPASGHGYRVYGTKGYFERVLGAPGRGSSGTFYYSEDRHTERCLERLPVDEIPLSLAGTDAAKDGHGGADTAILQAFFAAIRGGGPSPIPLREALRMTLPGIAAAESARAGGRLTVIRYPWSRGPGEQSG